MTDQPPFLFLNYRHADTGPVAERLFAFLERALPNGYAFMDKDVPPGTKWPDELRREARRATVMLVLVGPRWLELRDEVSKQRLIDREGDWVKEEILTAFECNTHVVPVHVDGAAPLSHSMLAPRHPLARIADLNSLALDAASWEDGCNRLLDLLGTRGFPTLPLAEPFGRPWRHGALAELIAQRAQRRRDEQSADDLDRRIRELKGEFLRGPMLAEGYVVNDRYELLTRLGQGGFGVLWRAWDHQRERAVAVKLLLPHLVHSKDVRERFLRGARTMSELNHPSIVVIVDQGGVDQQHYWYAMEFVEGGDLAQAVVQRRVESAACMQALRDVADALDHAYKKRRLVHRDVKPSNILLVDRSGQAKLTDFDLVRLPDTTQLTGTVPGTHAFAAPEILDGKPASRASDVYALAMTFLYVHSGGRLPAIGGDSVREIARQAGLRPSQTNVILQALSQRADARPASAGALLQELALAALDTRPTHRPISLAVGIVGAILLVVGIAVVQGHWLSSGIAVVVLSLVTFAKEISTWIVGRVGSARTPQRRVLVVGHGRWAGLEAWCKRTSAAVAATLDFDRNDAAGPEPAGWRSQLLTVAREQVDLLLALPDGDIGTAEVQELFAMATRAGIPAAIAPVWEPVSGQGALTYVRTVSCGAASSRVKRLIDVAVSLVLVVLLLPLLTVVALAIKVTSSGPILFRQTRVGLHGRRFTSVRFRTMYVDAEAMRERLLKMNEQSGPAFKMANDPRINPVGRFLRRYGIDELPTMFNVLGGSMSLVGPRPAIPAEFAHYEVWQRRRLSVKPGITCIWQTSDRQRTTFERWMELDLHYIDNWSHRLDLKIMLAAAQTFLRGEGI